MIILVFFTSIWSQEIIAEGMTGDDLLDFLRLNYKTNSTLGYNHARDTLYLQIDRNNGQVKGVYTNYSVTLPDGIDPSIYLYENGLNCEHVWPQSMGAGYEPQKSDMHLLRPCKENVNSSRGNKPFGEINDWQTDKWYWLDQIVEDAIPSSNINEYSESEDAYFEPREEKKGDIARTMFYFYTMYLEVANEDFWQDQKETLKIWHEQDPSNNDEVIRTWAIAGYQQNKPNPFILDNTLIERVYFYDGFVQGDINEDGVLNILDIVALVVIV